MARTRNFADVIRAKMSADPGLAEEIRDEEFSADVAQKVYEARMEAGLTQKKLAELVGTTQSVISRIEDADYDGHSFRLLRRIADALGKKLQIEFYGCVSARKGEDVETYSPAWKCGESWPVSVSQPIEVNLPTPTGLGGYGQAVAPSTQLIVYDPKDAGAVVE